MDVDRAMMERCIELSRIAGEQGEHPFATVICRDGKVVAEATNRTVQDKDATRHSDMVAISEAQKVLGTSSLNDCTIYTTGEPCALCAYAIRQTRIGKVVYGFRSPLMGGVSRWNILTDEKISSAMPEVFAPPPEIVAGLLREEAEAVWRDWNRVIWAIIRLRDLFGGDPTEDGRGFRHMPRAHGGLWHRLTSVLRWASDRWGGAR